MELTLTLLKYRGTFNNPKRSIRLHFYFLRKIVLQSQWATVYHNCLWIRKVLNRFLVGGLVSVLINSKVISIFITSPLCFKQKNQVQYLLQLVWSGHPWFPLVVQVVSPEQSPPVVLCFLPNCLFHFTSGIFMRG